MRLTVLVPLIGVFLLFNQQTAQLTALPDFFLKDLGLAEDSSLNISNLYFTYFGLCALGGSALLFSVFCPAEIVGEPNAQAYAQNSAMSDGPVLAKASFRTVLEIHFQNEGEDWRDTNPQYTDELEGNFHSLMQEIYEAYNAAEAAEPEFERVGGVEFEDGIPEVMTGSGYLDFTELARALWMNVRADWAFTFDFFDLAHSFIKDISYVKHRSLDYTKYKTRLLISLLYLLGFTLLLIPTVKVFVLLGLNLIG